MTDKQQQHDNHRTSRRQRYLHRYIKIHLHVLQQPSKYVHETGEPVPLGGRFSTFQRKVTLHTSWRSKVRRKKPMRFFTLEDEDSTFLRNVGTKSPIDTASCHRRPHSSATNLWEYQISSPPKCLFVFCAKIFRFFSLKQRAQMHEKQDAVRVFRHRKTRYNRTVIFCSGKSTSKLSPQSRLVHEASYLSLPCLLNMLRLCNRLNTFYKYSFNLSSYVTENTTLLHYKRPLLERSAKYSRRVLRAVTRTQNAEFLHIAAGHHC